MKKSIIFAAVSIFGFSWMMANAQSLPAIAIMPQTLAPATINTSYTEMLSASTTAAGPFTWTIYSGSLPPGLSLVATSDGDSAVISGIPNTLGAYTFTVDTTNGVIAATQAYNMSVDTNSEATTTTMVTTTIVVESSTLAAELQGAESELAILEAALAAETSSERDLTIGSVGPDVTALQQFLNKNGYPVAASGPGSAGNETDYFGPLTQAALAAWQTANGVSPALGYYGPITRAKINL